MVKAYDMVDWEYLSGALQSCGIGPKYRHWISLMYNKARPPQRRMAVNGFRGDGVPILSGGPGRSVARGVRADPERGGGLRDQPAPQRPVFGLDPGVRWFQCFARFGVARPRRSSPLGSPRHAGLGRDLLSPRRRGSSASHPPSKAYVVGMIWDTVCSLIQGPPL